MFPAVSQLRVLKLFIVIFIEIEFPKIQVPTYYT